MALFAIVAVGANAQQGNFTIWWGGSIANISGEGGSGESAFKALNLGAAYTAPIDRHFDWSVGAGYVTKGVKDWDPGFLQLEGNAAWNFVKQSNLKFNLFTGPYMSLLLSKDDAIGTKTFDLGWQGGLGATYKHVSVKLGYEYGFCDMFKGGESKNSTFLLRVGYTF